MNDKTFKLNPGEELDIFIRRKKPDSGDSSKKRIQRGLIEPFRFNDVLPRRLTPGGIRIFDMGQIVLDGENITVITSYLPEVTPEEGYTHVNAPVSLEEYTATADSLRSEVLGLFDDEETEFYEIKKGDTRFEKNVTVKFPKDSDPDYEASLDNAPEWTEKGLKITAEQAQNLTIKTYGFLFNAFEMKLSEMKVTIEPYSGAPEFPFTPSAKMEIYLFPVLVYHYATMRYSDGILTGATITNYKRVEDSVGYIVHLYPRTPVSIDNTNDYIVNVDSLTIYQWNYKLLTALLESPEILRVFRGTRTLSAGNPTNYIYTHTTADISEIPFSPAFDSPDDVNDPDPVYYEPLSVGGGSVILDYLEDNNSTRLKAIIKQGEDIYYLWQ